MPEIVKLYYSNNGTKEALVEFIGKPLEDILMTKPDQRLLVRNEADRKKVEWLYEARATGKYEILRRKAESEGVKAGGG